MIARAMIKVPKWPQYTSSYSTYNTYLSLNSIFSVIFAEKCSFGQPFWILCPRKKNAQHLQSGIHQIWIQHIQIDKKQQKNIIYYEKQGHTIISITPSLDYFYDIYIQG